MTWVALGVTAVNAVNGASQRRRARKELQGQQIAESDATRRQLADDAGARVASDNARSLAAEREVLSDQAETEALRQARLASVETNVDIAQVTGTERQRRRRAFQEAGVGGGFGGFAKPSSGTSGGYGGFSKDAQ